jgi:pyruvate formate lyase activating enzyme
MNSIFCGIEKLSLVDFDGYISCTLFTSGCNYRCPFCHNSPLIKEQPSLKMEEILNYLSVRKKMLDAVVITGGEPTLHKELPSVLKQIKDLGYIIKLDTNGTNPKMLKELIDKKLIDYVAMDIKASSNCYSLVTGVINPFLDNIKESINILKTSNINFEFRTTLVNEYHDINNIKQIAVELVGAKRLYLQRFVDNENCLNSGLTAVKKEDAEIFQKELLKTLTEVNLRGYV